MREVEKVLLFRGDISPFLAHLTSGESEAVAKSNLDSILSTKTLRYGSEPFCEARYRYDTRTLDDSRKLAFFSAISFTETPLSEIHNLLQIARRKRQLSPFGVVFLKERLKKKGVGPVFYMNNMKGDKDRVVHDLCRLIDTQPRLAARILPYISIFGKYLTPLYSGGRLDKLDFTWEREWRYASGSRKLKFSERDVFIGLCPESEISYFENRYSPIRFIDPRMNMKWYAEKLVEARQRVNMKNSVV